MSDTNVVPQGTDPPVVPAIAPAAVVVPPKVDAEPEVRMTPAQLKARLEEEREKGAKRAASDLASTLGVDLATAKKLIADAKDKDEASKSEVQKLVEQNAQKDAQLKELAVYKQAAEGRAAVEFSMLTPEQQAAVEALSGDNAAKRLAVIDTLRPTWAAAQKAADDSAKAAAAQAALDAAKAAEEAKKAAPAPKIPAPASTTPAAPPPAPAQPGTPTNHLAVWEAMKVSNPAAAARYRVTHEAAIRAAKQATG